MDGHEPLSPPPHTYFTELRQHWHWKEPLHRNKILTFIKAGSVFTKKPNVRDAARSKAWWQV